jgi:hypothetical protein
LNLFTFIIQTRFLCFLDLIIDCIDAFCIINLLDEILSNCVSIFFLFFYLCISISWDFFIIICARVNSTIGTVHVCTWPHIQRPLTMKSLSQLSSVKVHIKILYFLNKGFMYKYMLYDILCFLWKIQVLVLSEKYYHYLYVYYRHRVFLLHLA